MCHVLVLEEEQALAELISLNLQHAGYAVTLARSPEQAQKVMDNALPDLLVHGWQGSSTTGIQALRRWRASKRTKELPVIVLSSVAQDSDKIAALDAGADDFLTHPFSINELTARMRAVLRRKTPEVLETQLCVGRLKLDPSTRRLAYSADDGDVELRAGPTEFRVLHFFMANPERVYTRAQLLDRIWGDHVFIQERTVDVHVQRLRRVLAPADCQHMVESVRGSGYRFTQERSSSSYKPYRRKEVVRRPCQQCPSLAAVSQPVSLTSALPR